MESALTLNDVFGDRDIGEWLPDIEVIAEVGQQGGAKEAECHQRPDS